MRRLLRRKRGCGHAGLGVGFQQDQTIQPARLVPAEIGAADATAAQSLMRAQGIVQTGGLDLGRDLRR